MDTRKLAALWETIQSESINQAAEKLGYTQSGLTYLLNTLETELNIHLLTRTHKGVVLSEHGKELLPYLQDILKAESAFLKKRDELTDQRLNRIRIGAYSSVSNAWLPAALMAFRKIYPDVVIDIKIDSHRLPEWLRDGEIDFAIMDKYLANDFEWEHIYDDRMYACLPANHPLARESFTTLDKLVDYPFILPVSNTQNIVYTALKKQGLPSKDILIVDTIDATTLIQMVAQGLGVSFISRLYAPTCPGSVHLLPIHPPLIRQLSIVCRNKKKLYSNPYIVKFIDCLRQHIPE